MKKGIKWVARSILVVLCSFFLLDPVTCWAEQKNEVTVSEAQLQQAEKIVEEGNGQYALALLTENGLVAVDAKTARVSVNKGYVTGDGVRLRKQPKSTATVLELMSKNEVVVVDYSASSLGCSSGNWMYVKRVKTGTWGWMNSNYLATP